MKITDKQRLDWLNKQPLQTFMPLMGNPLRRKIDAAIRASHKRERRGGE